MRFKKSFTVFLFTVLLVSPVLFFSGCFSDDEEGFSYKTIQVDAYYNDTIKAFGSNVYKVDIPTSGNYIIGIENLGSDCGITVCDYVPGASSLDDLIPHILFDIDENDDDQEEVRVESLDAKSYFLVVDEWDNKKSNYTLFVISGTILKSVNTDKTLNTKVNNIDLKDKKTDAKWLEYRD